MTNNDEYKTVSGAGSFVWATGVTGLKIRKIVEGERDLEVLASFRGKKCKSDIETIKMAECDAEIEKTIKILEDKFEPPIGTLDELKQKPRRKNKMRFDVREELFRLK